MYLLKEKVLLPQIYQSRFQKRGWGCIPAAEAFKQPPWRQRWPQNKCSHLWRVEFCFYIIVIYLESKLPLRINQEFMKKLNCDLNIHDEFNIDSFLFAIFYPLTYKIQVCQVCQNSNSYKIQNSTSSRTNIRFEHILGEIVSKSAKIHSPLMWKCLTSTLMLM